MNIGDKFAKQLALTLAAVLLMMSTAVPAAAQQSQPLQLPADLEANEQQTHSVPYEEYRVGGRLERVTVTRENGTTEVYRNNRTDTVWNAQENEIGEVPNMRQWVIGTW